MSDPVVELEIVVDEEGYALRDDADELRHSLADFMTRRKTHD